MNNSPRHAFALEEFPRISAVGRRNIGTGFLHAFSRQYIHIFVPSPSSSLWTAKVIHVERRRMHTTSTRTLPPPLIRLAPQAEYGSRVHRTCPPFQRCRGVCAPPPAPIAIFFPLQPRLRRPNNRVDEGSQKSRPTSTMADAGFCHSENPRFQRRRRK